MVIGDALKRLAYLATLPDGWDGPGSRKVSPKAVDLAKFILEPLFRNVPWLKEPGPGIFARPDEGGINIEWAFGHSLRRSSVDSLLLAIDIDVHPFGETVTASSCDLTGKSGDVHSELVIPSPSLPSELLLWADSFEAQVRRLCL